MHAPAFHPPEVATQHVIPLLSPINRRVVHFSGRVQGVGFRYTARSIAQEYDVAGYVRNLPDGRVELVLEGKESETQRVVDTLVRKMGCFVRGVTMQVTPATGEFDHFSIRHG